MGRASPAPTEFLLGRLFVEDFGHEVTLVVVEATATVEFDGWVAMGDLEVEELGVVLAGGGFSEIEELRTDSLSAVGGFDEQFVDPCAFAAVFEAVVETDHEVADWRGFFADDVDDAVERVQQEFGKICAERGFVEWLRPGIIVLHVAHHFGKSFEVGDGSLGDGGGKGVSQPCTASNLEYVELIVN